MALPAPIFTSISNFFGAYVSITNYNAIKSDGNKYELYIYSLVHDGIRVNHTLTPRNLNVGKFQFKCSPGPINTSYSHFEFLSGTGRRLELRNGIEYSGYRMAHEVDVSVQDSGARNGTRPAHTLLLLGVECKFYSSANSLKGEARKNLGAINDLTRTSHALPTGINVGCIHCGIGFSVAFATNISVASVPLIQNYLNDYGLNPRFGILPGTTEEANFVQFITRESLRW